MAHMGLTEAEWQVMECLWTSAPRTGREIIDALGKTTGWSRSTTLTLLRRLEDKGAVSAVSEGGMKHYRPQVAREAAAVQETEHLLERVYQGSVSLMVSSLAKKQTLSQEEIDKLVCKATELGWQFGIHTIGDMAEDRALHAFAEADKIRPVKELRHYLIHYQLPYEDQWPIMRELGVGVCLQPTLVSTMGEAPLFWPEQSERFQSAGLMFKNGILAGGSSDSPVVSPNPMLGMYYAITRKDETTGGVLSKGDESKVTPIQALIMWTKNSAFFSHDDDKMGSIEVGNFADMCLFDTDFIEGDVEAYRTTTPAKTFLGGKVVYER